MCRPHQSTPTSPRGSLADYRWLRLWIAVVAIGAAGIASGAERASTGIIPNLGQVDPAVRYYARSSDGFLYVTDQALVLDLAEQGLVVWIRLADVSPGAHFEPVGERPTRLHFFLGSDPGLWKANVPMYDALVYREIEAGVDLWLEVDDCAVRYELRGPAGGTITAQNLVRSIEPAGSPVIVQALAEQPRSGVLRWREAANGPDLTDRADDPTTLSYSTYLGGSLNDRAHALMFDPDGNPILGGYTQSSSFPSTAGSYDPTHNGGYDAHVCKFTADASTLLWATFIGGSLEDRVFALNPDSNGNLVFSGHTYSANFPTTGFAYDRTLGGTRDAYVAKLNATGSVLLWSTYLGGSNEDRSWDMAVDDQDRPILSGDTYASDFPTTPGAFDETFSSGQEGFVTKVASDGRSLVWSTLLGGTASDYVKYMTLGADQQPVLCGATASTTFPTTPGAFDESYNGGQDCFVAKLNPTGTALVFGTFLGGALTDLGEVIVTHPSGDVVLTGSTTSLNFPTTDGAYDTSANGVKDAFITRLSAAGDGLVYSTYVGGSADDEPWSLTLDRDGGPIFSGYVQSVDFPTSLDAYDSTHNGRQDANITQLDPSGSALLYSTYFGGSELEGGWALALDASGNPVVTGPSSSPNLPTTSGVYNPLHNGGVDEFLARFEIASSSSVPAGPDPFEALQAGPNPFSEAIELHLHLAEGGPARVLVLDAAGRRLKTLLDGSLRSGPHSLTWDGVGANGQRLPAGVYWIRAEAIPNEGSRSYEGVPTTTTATRVLAQRKVILVGR